MHELKYSVFLAGNGWAVYEVATQRVMEVDGRPQAGLRFRTAASSATLLNASAAGKARAATAKAA